MRYAVSCNFTNQKLFEYNSRLLAIDTCHKLIDRGFGVWVRDTDTELNNRIYGIREYGRAENLGSDWNAFKDWNRYESATVETAESATVETAELATTMNYRQLQTAVKELKAQGYVVAHQPLNAPKETLQRHYESGIKIKAQDSAPTVTATDDFTEKSDQVFSNESHLFRPNTITLLTPYTVADYTLNNDYCAIAPACRLHRGYDAIPDDYTIDHQDISCDIPVHTRILPSDMLNYSHLQFLTESFINCLGQRVDTVFTPPYSMPFSDYMTSWVNITGHTSYSSHSYHYHESAIASGVTRDVNNGQSTELTCSIAPLGEPIELIHRGSLLSNYKISKAEGDAIALSSDSKALLQRLKDARSVLNDYLAKRFKTYTYDFPSKRLVSSCGHFYLQWKLRYNPDQPEDYGNQQSSRGSVTCLNARPKVNTISNYTTV